MEITGAGISGLAGTRSSGISGIRGISVNNQGSRSMGQDNQTLFHEISRDFTDDGSQSENKEHTKSGQVKRSGIFLWTSDSSPVEAGNWAEGYPIPGINKDSE